VHFAKQSHFKQADYEGVLRNEAIFPLFI
jgi:hypothetical protein